MLRIGFAFTVRQWMIFVAISALLLSPLHRMDQWGEDSVSYGLVVREPHGNAHLTHGVQWSQGRFLIRFGESAWMIW